MSLPKPYYHDERAGITIYHGDAREILPHLPPVDLVLTDPPYGINLKYASYHDSLENWFSLMESVVPTLRDKSKMMIMPSCRIKALDWWYSHFRPEWIIAWYKGSPGHSSHIGFNDWEPLLVWGKPAKQMHDHFQTVCGFDMDEHPCPKPVEWAQWLISRATDETWNVCDPFMGSGTTLRAAKDLGRKAIGIEISEEYCRIAVKRLQQDVLPLSFESTVKPSVIDRGLSLPLNEGSL